MNTTNETEDVEVLADHMRQEERVYALINLGYIDEVPLDIRDSMRVIVETRLSRKGLALVANK